MVADESPESKRGDEEEYNKSYCAYCLARQVTCSAALVHKFTIACGQTHATLPEHRSPGSLGKELRCDQAISEQQKYLGCKRGLLGSGGGLCRTGDETFGEDGGNMEGGNSPCHCHSIARNSFDRSAIFKVRTELAAEL
jgi:hypothetical protein